MFSVCLPGQLCGLASPAVIPQSEHPGGIPRVKADLSGRVWGHILEFPVTGDPVHSTIQVVKNSKGFRCIGHEDYLECVQLLINNDSTCIKCYKAPIFHDIAFSCYVVTSYLIKLPGINQCFVYFLSVDRMLAGRDYSFSTRVHKCLVRFPMLQSLQVMMPAGIDGISTQPALVSERSAVIPPTCVINTQM